MNKILSKPILLGLILIGVCIVTYTTGILYQRFINNPTDFASLIFIIAIFIGAIYHQVRGFEKK